MGAVDFVCRAEPAFSMRRGGGSGARRRRAVAAVRRTRRMRGAGGRRSGFGGRRNRLRAGYPPGASRGRMSHEMSGEMKNAPSSGCRLTARGRSPSC
jgi:hypothetical protein